MTARSSHLPAFDCILPEQIAWEKFPDPHDRPTTPVRILKETDPFILQADFPAHFHADLHWHPHDTIYLITKGRLRFGDEGWFEPGDVRWVKAGHSYGPEEAGPEGVQFFLVSLGGAIGLNWADLYDVPKKLTDRLERLGSPKGRARLESRDLNALQTSYVIESVFEEDPYLSRLLMKPNAEAAFEGLGCDGVYFVRAGQVSIEGQLLTQDQLLSVSTGSDRFRLTTADHGSDILVLTVGERFAAPLS